MSAAGSDFDTSVSIVVPLRDAAGYVESVVLEIDRVVRACFRHYEIVLVDDASTDDTVEIVERIQRKVGNTQLYCLNRRSGPDVAFVAGLDNSIGDFVITLNARTDPLDLIPVLWQKAQEGHEVVCGVRRDRLGGGLHSWITRTFFRMFEAATGLRIPVGISDLRLCSRRVVNYITQNNDRHMMLKVLPFFASHRVAIVEYAPLQCGRGLRDRSLPAAILTGATILFSSSIRPLRLLTVMALLASSLSLLFAIYVLAVALIKRHVVEGWISLALPMAVMFFFIFTILGILSEYIYLLAQQSGNRPVYSISRESASSVLDIRGKVNVVEGGGEFAKR